MVQETFKIIGYACVSTADQNLGRQLSMLKKYGCEKIIEEKFTGTMKDRPGLQTSMNVIQANGFS
ncbi:recombinase family protein [Priestia megaterium]|nr:recombinase family protein [Priestia megaterium]